MNLCQFDCFGFEFSNLIFNFLFFRYRQCFDLEGETGGVVVRGIGTAVKLNRHKKMENLVSRNR